MSDNINNMNFKQLRNEVQLLRDELAIFKRKYEDIIYNLDTDNFSSRFVKEQGNMRTAIEVTAEGIKTKVSNEEFQSAITQTAEQIKSEVSALSSTDSDLYTMIDQTSSEIRSVVSKNISAKFISYSFPTHSNTSDEEKGMLCEYDGTLYYYNDITWIWDKYPYADGIKSQFLQTTSGFELTGDVYISGDAIVGGTITGAALENAEGTHRLEMAESIGTDYGTFLLYNQYYGDVPYFSIYDDTYGKITLFAAGEEFLKAYSSGGMTVIPYGYWDFSSCDHNIVAKFG